MRRLASLLTAVLAAAVLVAAPAGAQQSPGERQVALVADSVRYDTLTGQVIAEGAVQVFYGTRTLTAERIVYDSVTERISAEGELVLRDAVGNVTVYADTAELDAALRDGLVLGARAVMDRDVKLSAVEARRVDDRYNALSKAVYSPCAVCAEDPTPLWRIRARRVIHDEEANIIHYENATFDVLGVPVFWTPYFRHADPTVERTSGFLVPSFANSSTFGYGVRAPYYWVLDDFSDATIEPFVTTGDGALLLGEYRRRFTFGDLQVRASGTVNDYGGHGPFHGHLDALGEFETEGGVDYGFDFDLVTDDGYLRRYELSDDDRLESELYLRDYGTRTYFDLAAVYFQSLREGETDGEVPFVLPDFEARYELPRPVAGGVAGFFADSAAVVRTDGDDAARVSLGGDWEREYVSRSGVVLTPFAEARVDFFASGDNDAFTENADIRLAPLAGIEARYPLINDRRPGVAHVLEPIAQAIVAPYGGNDGIPVEDSLLTEFDETSLFARDHFPGLDSVEEGPRLNYGLRYERIADEGLDLEASLGQVLRLEDADEFSPGSGLVDSTSDLVGAWAVSFAPWVTARQRVRLSTDLELTRNEVYGGIELDPVGLDVGYIFLEQDPRIEAPDDREEISAAARLRLTDAWSVGTYLQHDIGRDELVETGGSITYENECIAVDLGVEKRFTDVDDAPSALSFGLQVRLLTLGTEPEDRERATGVCGPPART
ncbi:MAG TPA: LPS assembly protein LptD [Thermohalobaculum sp.]|nr:LPS assembly protein LptD [Thermohalobaculum sp.]